MTEYEVFARAEAARRGIDPDTAVTVWNDEGGLTEPARRGTFATGSSWWAPQLHYGGSGYEYLGAVAGMGNSFTALTGWQPGDPRAWKDAMRYALDAVARGGWGPWYGAKANGITGFAGVDRTRNWSGTPMSEWDYRENTMVTYNPDTPPIQQDDSFSCAPTSLRWAMTALGRHPGPEYIENLLLRDGIVTRADGLLDATGGQLAAWIGKPGPEYYGDDGFYGNNESVVSFDWCANEGAHTYPLLIGGRRWGHWSGLANYDAARGLLLLANPAPNWMGVGQTMDRPTFDALGPFSAVRVLHPDLLAPAPPQPDPPAPPVDTRLQRARAKLVEAVAILDEPG